VTAAAAASAPAAGAGRMVVVSTVGLDEEMAASIQQACEQASALPVRWADDLGDETLAAAPGQAPGAVLAALPPGERQIPERLLRFVTRDRPGAALLLLCRESLVRPSVTLQHGRITLVEPPFSVRRLASRLRVLLAGASADEASVPVREHQRPEHWLGVLSPAAAWTPLVDQSRGLTVVVPGRTAVAGDALAPVAAAVASQHHLAAGEALAAALVPLLGEEAGMIHLGPRGDEWLLYWPRPERPLWLCSTQRLPACWDLGVTAYDSPGHVYRVAAAAGDVLVTMPAGLSDWALGAAGPGVPALVASELTEAVADGGPALLEHIGERLRGGSGPAGALVIEAR
jgi:hypothetical protein